MKIHCKLPALPVRFGALAFILIAIAPLTARANISVLLSSIPLGGGKNHYFYSVQNMGPDDVVLVTINDAPQNDPDIAATLTAPPNFAASYDPGLGFIDSFPELGFAGLFQAGGPPVGNFTFDSSAAPPAFFTTFEALTVNGGALSGNVQFVPGANVPDAGSTALLAGIGLLGLAAARRKFPTP